MAQKTTASPQQLRQALEGVKGALEGVKSALEEVESALTEFEEEALAVGGEDMAKGEGRGEGRD